ncbi:MAG TPA: translation elongation factor Ts [Gemmatimonadales bacterium]|nr:translation elongation factor Ts [Gemmatimonadales bacterium]
MSQPITAKMVAELRARTGAGMMDCKAALEEAQGDMDRAVEILRKKGIAKADKRGDRSASQGLVVIEASPSGREAAMIELNCETDFVARNEDFIVLARELGKHALQQAPDGVHPGSAIEGQAFRGKTVGEIVKEVSGKVGEAMSLKRVARFRTDAGTVGHYLHHNAQSGAMVELEGTRGEPVTALARELALHVTSTDPLGVSEADIPADLLARERRIAEEQVVQEGKPEKIREKIVEGKLRKFVAERTLLGQAFVKDDSRTVSDLVKETAKQVGGSVTVKRLVRFKVGES